MHWNSQGRIEKLWILRCKIMENEAIQRLKSRNKIAKNHPRTQKGETQSVREILSDKIKKTLNFKT